MIKRCENPNHRSYEDYGQRGIKVCEEWRHSVSKFYEDMGPRPNPKATIERLNVDEGYNKNNCKWELDKTEQNFNQQTRRDNNSGCPGVYWDAKSGKWRAAIQKHKVRLDLGMFACLEAAIQARKAAEIEIYGYEKSKRRIIE